MAPTILYLMGVEPLKSMDGKVIEEAIRSEFLRTHPITFNEEDDGFLKTKREEYIPTAEEEAAQMRHLAALGYIEE